MPEEPTPESEPRRKRPRPETYITDFASETSAIGKFWDASPIQEYLAKYDSMGSALQSALALDSYARQSERSIELQEEISKLRRELQNASAQKGELEKKITQNRHLISELNDKITLSHLLNSTDRSAHERITQDPTFKEQFFQDTPKAAFIVSIDIRRSTELMLKARSPKGFSQFITGLCGELTEIIKSNHGIVDKFTGDGVLAFFPAFYSGPDAGLHALNACTKCIAAFERRYKDSRGTFNAILRDVGLGIGVDYGEVHMLDMAGSLTVVGQAVVYACRLGSAPAGKIYFNQPAIEEINRCHPHSIDFQECDLAFKHEGAVICYDVVLRNDAQPPRLPEWKGDSNGSSSSETPPAPTSTQA